MRKFHKQSESGMTIIEILIVIALMGVVMTLVVSNLTDSQEEANIDTTRLKIQKVEKSLKMFRIHMLRYPQEKEGLQALLSSDHRRWKGPYASRGDLSDVFGNELSYRLEGRKPIVYSLGPDGIDDTEDDIYRDTEPTEESDVYEIAIPTGN